MRKKLVDLSNTIRNKVKKILLNPWILSPSSNLLIGLLSLIISTITARYFGPAMRGVVAESILWPTLVLTAGSLVNTQSVVYFWSKAKTESEKAEVLGICLMWALLLSIALVPISLGLNFIILGSQGKVSYTAANIYTFNIPLIIFSYIFISLFIAEKKMHIFWGLRISISLLHLGGVILLSALKTLNLSGLIGVLLFSQLMPLIMSIVLYLNMYSNRIAWNKNLFTMLGAYGIKTNLAGLPYQLNVRLDQALMSIFLPAVLLGYYAVAFSWSSGLSFIGAGLSMVMLAKGASIDRDDREKLANLFSQFRLVFIMLLGLGLFAAAATPFLFPLIFGMEYLPSVLPAVILCLASIALALNTTLHEVARGLGFPEIGIRAESFGLIISIVLLIILLPAFGGVGAAIASLIGYSIVFVILLKLFAEQVRVSPQDIIRPTKGDFVRIQIEMKKTYSWIFGVKKIVDTAVFNGKAGQK